MNRKLVAPLIIVVLVLSLAAETFADVIRLKDGTVIRGEVISFKDQQFTVLIGTGARGRRSRIMLYMEDVESIEFDSTAGSSGGDTGAGDTPAPVTTQPQRIESPTPQPTPAQPSQPPSGSPAFFTINVRVRADNTTNGWTNSGLVVRRGQRIRISASGRASLGSLGYTTPAGLPNIQDKDKLMRNEATGALIAVIGDDNDDFIMIGRSREFVAQRDGVLFLGINEGNLNDNAGYFDIVIEAEAGSGGARP